MGKNQDPGSGINIPDPQHWTDQYIDPISDSPIISGVCSSDI
jgi:hypothetical protein